MFNVGEIMTDSEKREEIVEQIAVLDTAIATVEAKISEARSQGLNDDAVVQIELPEDVLSLI
jgi:hypothetical protein